MIRRRGGKQFCALCAISHHPLPLLSKNEHSLILTYLTTFPWFFITPGSISIILLSCPRSGWVGRAPGRHVPVDEAVWDPRHQGAHRDKGLGKRSKRKDLDWENILCIKLPSGHKIQFNVESTLNQQWQPFVNVDSMCCARWVIPYIFRYWKRSVTM